VQPLKTILATKQQGPLTRSFYDSYADETALITSASSSSRWMPRARKCPETVGRALSGGWIEVFSEPVCLGFSTIPTERSCSRESTLSVSSQPSPRSTYSFERCFLVRSTHKAEGRGFRSSRLRLVSTAELGTPSQIASADVQKERCLVGIIDTDPTGLHQLPRIYAKDNAESHDLCNVSWQLVRYFVV
jgi:hypothetical protein